MSIDVTELERLIAEQEAAIARLPARISGRQVRAMRELLGIARSAVHVQSGHLRDSLAIIQPSLGGEISESSITSTASYAGFEADKGGEHDYPALTIEQGAAALDELMADIAALIEAAFLGRGAL